MIASPGRLVLASASPRRAELLRAAGFDFDFQVVDVDEAVLPDERPDLYVRRVAEAKARAAAGRSPRRAILGADTTVVVEGTILGKPGDVDDAARMLRLLSGRAHDVMTGVCLVHLVPRRSPPTDGANGSGDVPCDIRLEVTTVEFAPLSRAEIDWYIASGEPMGKAGAYAIQGLAARFVTRIGGSYSNVVGLPVALVYGMCREAGLLLS